MTLHSGPSPRYTVLFSERPAAFRAAALSLSRSQGRPKLAGPHFFQNLSRLLVERVATLRRHGHRHTRAGSGDVPVSTVIVTLTAWPGRLVFPQELSRSSVQHGRCVCSQ